MATLKSRWDTLHGERHSVLTRLRDAAHLTCPFLLPPEGKRETDDQRNSYQSEGNYGVTSLASKLALTLVPPNTPFFRFDIDPYTLEAAKAALSAKGLDPEASAERFQGALRLRSQMITNYIAQVPDGRYKLWLTIASALAVGQGLLEIPDELYAQWRFHRLDSYVTKRSGNGRLNELIIREYVSRIDLPERLRESAPKATPADDPSVHQSDNDTVDVYTCAKRVDTDKFEVWQELGDGREVTEVRGNYKEENLPYIVVPCLLVDGMDYAEGFAPQFLGTLRSLHMNSRSLTLQGLLATRKFMLIKPGSADVRLFQKAQAGDALPGDAEGVQSIGFDNVPELRVAMEVVNTQRRDVGAFFMTYRSLQRDGERVTAEEIRTLANELENANGGIYSQFSSALQLRILKRVEAILQEAKKLPKLETDGIEVRITAGIEGLGDALEAQKIVSWLGMIRQWIPEAVTALRLSPIILTLGRYLGVDTKAFVKTDEEMAQEAQQAQAQALSQQAAPGVAQEWAKGQFNSNQQ